MRIIFCLIIVLIASYSVKAQNNIICPLHKENLMREIIEVENENDSIVCRISLSLEEKTQIKLCPYGKDYIYEKALKKCQLGDSFEISYCLTCTQEEYKYLLIGGEWEEFVNPDGFFKINFPGKPQIKCDIANNIDEVDAHFYSFQSYFIKYSVSVRRFPQPYFRLDKVLLEWIPEVNTYFYHYPGFEKTVKSSRIIKTKIFLIENYLYEIELDLPNFNDFDPLLPLLLSDEIANTFFDSFNVIHTEQTLQRTREVVSLLLADFTRR